MSALKIHSSYVVNVPRLDIVRAVAPLFLLLFSSENAVNGCEDEARNVQSKIKDTSKNPRVFYINNLFVLFQNVFVLRAVERGFNG